MKKNPTPEDSLQRQLASCWEALDWRGLGERRRNSSLRGGLFNLLAPIAALHVFGTSSDLAEKRAVIRKAKNVNRDLPMNEEDRKRIAAVLEELRVRVQFLFAAATSAEEELARDGWELDPKKRIVKSKMAKGQPGNSPQKFLLRCIEAAADNFPDLKGEPLRKAVADVLSLYFPADVLETGARGNIAHTLENYRRK